MDEWQLPWAQQSPARWQCPPLAFSRDKCCSPTILFASPQRGRTEQSAARQSPFGRERELLVLYMPSSFLFYNVKERILPNWGKR